ncbi:MAG TPA: S-layer homology domain-containing protein, partial [Clostridiales bacterium]|nr:S-layer homology domain-containing protein [Clostridiales bacterium]
FAQFLYNYAGTPKVSGALRGFADTASVSGWAKKALTWANQNGVVSGKPSGGKLYLDPKGRATRAEAAAMLMKYQKM